MATKTTLRAEMRSRRRARRADSLATGQLFSPDTSHSPIPVRDRAEAEGLARQIRALASSMGEVTLPTLFVPTPLEREGHVGLEGGGHE